MRRLLLRAVPGLIVIALAACTTGAAVSPSPTALRTAAPRASDRATDAPLTPVPATTPSTPSQSVTSKTETAFGRIWDALPDDFPTSSLSALTPVEPDEPASAAFDASGSAQDVAVAMQNVLERATFSTLSMSGPFEDGSLVIESVGATTTECRVRTTVAPLGGMTRVTILYGAECPFR